MAEDRVDDPAHSVVWIPRPDGSTDSGYLERGVLQVVGNLLPPQPLNHHLGGGKDLGNSCKGDRKMSPPFVWKISMPRWWLQTQLEDFLVTNGWKEPEVQAQLARGIWRVKAASRPSASASYLYDVATQESLDKGSPSMMQAAMELAGIKLV